MRAAASSDLLSSVLVRRRSSEVTRKYSYAVVMDDFGASGQKVGASGSSDLRQLVIPSRLFGMVVIT